MLRVRYSSVILLVGSLFLAFASGCSKEENSEVDPEYRDLQQAYQEKLKTDPTLQKKAEEKKQREI